MRERLATVVLSMAALELTATSALAAGETIDEQVLLDESGIKITAMSLSADGFMGPELKLQIENNSDTDLTVQTRNTSVNGYMVETMMSSEVVSGKKANDDMTIMNSDLEQCGIDTIADMELSFHIFTTDGWDDYLDTDQIKIVTSAQPDYEYTYDDSGDVVYEDGVVRIISKGIDEESSYLGPSAIFYMENLSDQPVTIQVRDSSINGFMVDPIMSEEIMPEKRSVTEMTFMSSDLEDNGIENIEDLEISFHIFNTDSWDTIADTEPVTIHY